MNTSANNFRAHGEWFNIGSGNGRGAFRQQPIAWTSAGEVTWRYTTSLNHNESTIELIQQNLIIQNICQFVGNWLQVYKRGSLVTMQLQK